MPNSSFLVLGGFWLKYFEFDYSKRLLPHQESSCVFTVFFFLDRRKSPLILKSPTLHFLSFSSTLTPWLHSFWLRIFFLVQNAHTVTIFISPKFEFIFWQMIFICRKTHKLEKFNVMSYPFNQSPFIDDSKGAWEWIQNSGGSADGLRQFLSFSVIFVDANHRVFRFCADL